MTNETAKSQIPRLAFSPAEAAESLGLSRTKIYDLLNRQDFPVFRVDGRVVIPVQPLEKWLENQVGGGSN